MLPQAYVYPAALRATRALLRRRTPLMRQRAELLAHGHNTNSQYNLPAIGKKSASKAIREGVAERCADPAVHKTIEVALALIFSDEGLLRAVERSGVQAAKHHDAHPRYLLQTVPGMGKVLSLVRLYALHHIDRFPTVQDVASYGRLVKWAKESGGQRVGTSGKKMGHAHLKGAFSEAAALLLRNNEAGQN